MAGREGNWRESISRLGQALQVPDLRRRLSFVGFMFALYVLGLHIPAPFVKPEAIQDLLGSGALGFIDILSGGAFKRLSILALGIVPYINASIIMQLLGIAVPAIQRMQKEGESGRKKLSSWTRYGTVALALVQATGLAILLNSRNAVDTSSAGLFALLPLIIVMTAGTSFLMWVGEQITDKGIGNGVSLVIFAGIMISFPSTFGEIIKLLRAQYEGQVAITVLLIVLLVAIFMAIVVFITYVHMAVRKLPIQHAKRVVGNRVFSSAGTYLPLKVVTAGVIPIIFAISVVMLPATIAQFLQGRIDQANPEWWWVALNMISPGQHWIGALLYFLLVVFFTYFYTAVVYNVQDISDNLKKHGSFIPGLRPGKQTEQYIDKVLTRITFAGAIFLGVVALLPYMIPVLLPSGTSQAAQLFPLWGGTSLLIVVGVALETMKQIEAHLVMRHYEGFIK